MQTLFKMLMCMLRMNCYKFIVLQISLYRLKYLKENRHYIFVTEHNCSFGFSAVEVDLLISLLGVVQYIGVRSNVLLGCA